MNVFKNKTLATLLAALLGTVGVHRFYLHGFKSAIPWLYSGYFLLVGSAGLFFLSQSHPDFGSDANELLHPAVLLAFLSGIVGCIEALVFALTPDAAWDARWNPTSNQKSRSGWPVIMIAILTLAFGATALLSIIAISVQVAAGGSA